MTLNEELKEYCMNEKTKIVLLRKYIPKLSEDNIENSIDRFVSGFKMSDEANDLLFAILCFVKGIYEEQSMESAINFLDSLAFSIISDDEKFKNQMLEILILNRFCPTAVLIYSEFMYLEKSIQLDLISECKRVIQESNYKMILKNYFSGR